MDGIILIDKPKDYTSHDVVAVIKKISKEKVGHTGTLDPNATGVLPLLIGKATGISKSGTSFSSNTLPSPSAVSVFIPNFNVAIYVLS